MTTRDALQVTRSLDSSEHQHEERRTGGFLPDPQVLDGIPGPVHGLPGVRVPAVRHEADVQPVNTRHATGSSGAGRSERMFL